ncbi:aldehyde dehydrogenase family protein [Streptomyces sp. NPDC060053]|uniref:aldehyde dehydrogenase family protein n=1 Tax=Streptomyces sp. NPDC060053 TaxID=3347047 RepID=UPI0036C7CB4F
MLKAVQFALTAGFLNTGQACIAGTRILAPESRLAEAKTALKAGVQALTLGSPTDPTTTVQPMVSKGRYERVQSYIRKGIEEGAEVLVGGEGKPAGYEAGNYVDMTDIRDKVALVTGASSGIGAATARALAEAGVKVGIAARARELVDQGTPIEAACRIVILEAQLEEAQRINEQLRTQSRESQPKTSAGSGHRTRTRAEH